MTLVPNDYQRGFNDAIQIGMDPDEVFVSEIAKRCAELRQSRGLSLQEAGDRAGFTKSHMWEFEQGRSRNPTLKYLLGLSRAYGVSLDYLIGGSSKAPPLDPEALRIACEVDALLRRARGNLKTERS